MGNDRENSVFCRHRKLILFIYTHTKRHTHQSLYPLCFAHIIHTHGVKIVIIFSMHTHHKFTVYSANILRSGSSSFYITFTRVQVLDVWRCHHQVETTTIIGQYNTIELTKPATIDVVQMNTIANRLSYSVHFLQVLHLVSVIGRSPFSSPSLPPRGSATLTEPSPVVSITHFGRSSVDRERWKTQHLCVHIIIIMKNLFNVN